jgi:hypothetical protein
MTVIRQRQRSTGQALAEFALVAPIFFLLLFALIEFGRAVYCVEMLKSAAREGARYGIVHGAQSGEPSGPYPLSFGVDNRYDPDGNEIVKRVKAHAVGVIGSSPGDFVVTPRWCADDGNLSDCPDTNPVGQGDGTNDRNETVKVTVSYTFRPLLAALLPLPTFTLTGDSTLVINH